MFHSSKQLGQNFLINKGIVDKIIAAAELSKDDAVLEIGPGKGALTEKLIARAGRVIAVEKDRRLYELLKEKFSAAKNLELINADILKLDFNVFPRQAREIFPERSFFPIFPERSAAESRGYLKNYKLIANIPYNITGQIFRKFLTNPPQPSFSPLRHMGFAGQAKGGSPSLYKREAGRDFRPRMLVVMVQKEVGERLMGKKNRSILSLLAELYGKVEKVCDVSAGSFFPAPKIMSSVIKLVAAALPPLEKGDRGGFINPPQPSFSPLRHMGFAGQAKGGSNHKASVIPAEAGIQTRISQRFELDNKILRLAKIGFSSKRKKLASNLSTGLKIDKKIINAAFAKIGLSENIRAEELSKADWLKLAEMI